MTEHVAVAVDEVVLLEAVEDDGHAAVEHLGQARLWVAESTHTLPLHFITDATVERQLRKRRKTEKCNQINIIP